MKVKPIKITTDKDYIKFLQKQNLALILENEKLSKQLNYVGTVINQEPIVFYFPGVS